MRRILGWLRGGSDELGWDDLVRRVVDRIAPLAHHGPRGGVTFPAQVEVRITVATGSAEVVQRFVAAPAFDREVGAVLANRCDCPPAALPPRSYRVAPGERDAIEVSEGQAPRWQLRVEGGDRDGAVLELPAGAGELSFGRGEWHGPDRQLRNDLVVCEQIAFVSRRAGRLHRTGARVEVEALDQGDLLVVRRRGGTSLRPTRTPTGRVALEPGDAIELGEGGGGRAVRLLVARAGEETLR